MLQCMQEHISFLSVAQVDGNIANARVQYTGIEQTHRNKNQAKREETKRDRVGMVYLRDTMRATDR